jgi:hypothetical protein
VCVAREVTAVYKPRGRSAKARQGTNLPKGISDEQPSANSVSMQEGTKAPNQLDGITLHATNKMQG